MNPSRIVPDWHPLTLIDQYLLARGWQLDEHGFWQAPASIVELYRVELGAGNGWRRGDAIRIQVEIDEAISFVESEAK